MDHTGPEAFQVRAKTLQQQLWQDLDHRYFSGVRVLRALMQNQAGSGQVAMPVVFTSGLGGVVEKGPRWLGEVTYGLSQTPQVWIDAQAAERDEALVLVCDAVEALFPEGMLADMFRAYVGLLQRLATDSSAWTKPVGPLVPATHLAQRAAVNATQGPLSQKMLHTLFLAHMEKCTDAPAVIAPDRSLTYQDLYQQACQVGHWLRGAGAIPNILVAVVMEPGWEQVVAVLGILMSGAAYLPIDPELPTERQHYLLAQGQVSLALTQSHLILSWPENIHRLAVDTAQLPDQGSLDIVQRPTDLAYVIYTSGSTGLPKGVIIDHRGAVNTILDINRRFGLTEQDRVLALSALNFDLSVYDIFGLLAVGGSIVLPAASLRRDPGHWAELMVKNGVTLWNTVPALMHMLVQHQGAQPLAAPLRLVMLSGDWIPMYLPERIRALWSEVKLISLGGATEASIWSIYYPIEHLDPAWTSIPYGKPLANQTFHVLNERLEPCPVWVPGQLYIGGIGLALGYWRDEGKTGASFIIHPETGERLYKTGDLGRYLPDGHIEFLGREDFQVKIRGHRIELGEIEAHLVRHAAVKEGVVAAVGEARGNHQLVAYIVPGERASQGRGPQPIDQAAYGLEDLEGVLTDPVARLEFKLQQPSIRQLGPHCPSVALPPPALDEVAYLIRQSYRDFLTGPISLEQFGAMLACLKPHSFPQAVLPKYRYGSAGNLYPVQTYLYLKPEGVVGLAPGAYYYHPLEHRLIHLSAEALFGSELYDGPNRAIFERAAFGLFLVGELAAIEPLYGQLGRDFCLLEAGYMSHLLMEVAPTREIGLCPIGGLNFEPLRDHFALGKSQILLHSFLGGTIVPEQTRTLPQPQATPHSLEASVQAYLAQKLPGYMVPTHYVVLETLPLAPNGKVDRKALPRPDLAGSPETDVPPADTLECSLVTIVQEILGLEHISVTQDFFALGANSLGLVQIRRRLQETFRQEIVLTDIFSFPTVRTLAQQLRQAATSPISDRSADQAEISTGIDPEQAKRLLAEMDQVSDAGVDALLRFPTEEE